MWVRAMTPADVDVLADLIATIPGQVEPAHELAQPRARAWVACQTGSDDPLGYAICSWVLDDVELLVIGVDPAARRSGVGRALLERVVEHALELGAARISLEVARGNSAARRLYESVGFREFNVRRGYYAATGEDALELELCLGAS